MAINPSLQQIVEQIRTGTLDFVLLKPPFKGSTYLLWFGPFAILLLGLLAVSFYLKRRSEGVSEAPAAPPLTAEEKERLERILKDGGKG